MSNLAKVEAGTSCEVHSQRTAFQALQAWIERDLSRLEAKWMFLSSPKKQIRFVVMERGIRNDA